MPWCNVLAVTIVIVATTFASSKVLSSTDGKKKYRTVLFLFNFNASDE